MSRTFSIWLFAWSLFAGSWSAGDRACAGQEARRDRRFEGPSASSIQAQVTRALKSERREVELISSRDVSNTAARLDNAMRSDSDFRELGEALEVSAFIEERARRKADNSATVTVAQRRHRRDRARRDLAPPPLAAQADSPARVGALGPAIAESSTPTARRAGRPADEGATSSAAPEPEVDEELEPAEPEENVAAGAPPPPKPKKRTPKKPVEREPVAETTGEAPAEEPSTAGVTKSGAHPALIASIGPRLTWRTLKYDGPTNFHSYKNEGGSPAFSLPLSVQYYPGAHSSNGWYSNLGLDLDFDYALGLKSKMPGAPDPVKTTAYELGAGAILPRFRSPIRAALPRRLWAARVRRGRPALTAAASPQLQRRAHPARAPRSSSSTGFPSTWPFHTSSCSTPGSWRRRSSAKT